MHMPPMYGVYVAHARAVLIPQSRSVASFSSEGVSGVSKMDRGCIVVTDLWVILKDNWSVTLLCVALFSGDPMFAQIAGWHKASVLMG